MSVFKDRVGEMFMAGFMGTDPMAASELIQRHHVGGIILFSRNMRDAAHAWAVCEKLQKLRRQVSDSPLFIALDQEGGCVTRITEGVTVFPGNMALGATTSKRFARQAGGVTADELLKLGINVNFAPVLDISSNPRNPGVGARSFGSDPELVARLGSAMIEGMQEKGLNATAKHFPGLGEARVDSHDELPSISAARDQLENRELLPFRGAIEAAAAFVMTAHCSYPSLDHTLAPATLSRPILTGLLREKMRFKGIVITDCLEMAAVEKNLSAPQSTQAAVRAGATMLLICHTLQKQVAAIESLARAVEGGDVAVETIDSAASIIASVKKRLKFGDDSAYHAIEPQKSLSEAIAKEAVTVVKNENSMIPLKLAESDKLAVIVPAFDVLTKVEEAAEPHEVLLHELGRRHPNLLYRKVSAEPVPQEVRECAEICSAADAMLILTYNLHLYPAQEEFVRILLDLERPSIVAAVRDPFDLAFIPKARACVATYGFRECSLKAMVEALFGEIDANGRLPVGLA